MKICFISSMHHWNDDRIFERAAIGLTTKGHEVIYISPGEKEMISEGVKIVPIPIRSRFLKHILSPFEAFQKMKTMDAEIYHFYNPNMMLLMIFWAKKGKKVFIVIHENYESRIDAMRFLGVLKKKFIGYYRSFENRMCSHYSGITVVTESMKQKLKSSGVPILIVDNVPYLSRLKDVELAISKEKTPTIITSGTHSEARNCLNAVEALPMIVKKIPDVKMKFVGQFNPKSYEQKLHKKASELGVSDHLITEGMLPWLDNFKRISSAHIGCVFYNDNLNNRVTLPNRLYEYMFCGLAVLGENFPEVKRVLNKTQSGLLVDSQNPIDIAEKVIDLFSNRGKLNEASKNAQNAILNTYNFEKNLEELIEFYEVNT